MCLSIEGVSVIRTQIELLVCRSQTVRFCFWYSYLQHYSQASLSCHTHSFFCVSRCIATTWSKYFRVMVSVFRTYQLSVSLFFRLIVTFAYNHSHVMCYNIFAHQHMTIYNTLITLIIRTIQLFQHTPFSRKKCLIFGFQAHSNTHVWNYYSNIRTPVCTSRSSNGVTEHRQSLRS